MRLILPIPGQDDFRGQAVPRGHSVGSQTSRRLVPAGDPDDEDDWDEDDEEDEDEDEEDEEEEGEEPEWYVASFA